MGMCNKATNLVFGGVGFVQVTIFGSRWRLRPVGEEEAR